ncbi:MAG: FliM/FliN family flagellar motor switch protein [bacterium]
MEQEQIDQLLAVDGDRAALPSTTDSVPMEVYDFRRPHRVSRERIRTLEVLYERLVKSLEGWLMARVRGPIELRLQSVEQISFGEYTQFLRSPCCSYLMSIKDGGGHQGVIDFGPELAYFLVDRLLGGGGEPTILERALTPIERMALRVVAERVMTQVEEIWRDYELLELAIDGFESVPETMRAVPHEDPVIVVTLAASFAEKSSVLSICLPLGVLEKFFVAAGGETKARLLSIGSEAEVVANRSNTEAQLRATSVPVRVRLPDFRLSLRDVAELRVGTVLATGLPTAAPLLAFVGPTPRYYCSAGWVGRKLAVRVLNTIDASGQAAHTLPTT